MTNPQVKERIETLSASVESCIQRAEFILRSLDSIIQIPEDAASASAVDLTASQVVRAANSIVNELRNVGIYYRTQLAQIAEDEKNGWMPTPATAAPAAPEPIDEAARRRQQLSAMADEQTRRATAAAAALTAAQEQEARDAQLVAHNLQMQQQQANQMQAPVPALEDPAGGLPAPIELAPRRIPGVSAAGANAPRKLQVHTAYERLMSSSVSPLLRIFAASPWLPNGHGTITIGSEGFEKWRDYEIDLAGDFTRLVTLPQGFYGVVSDGTNKIPRHVVIRLKDTMLIWNFSMEEGSLYAWRPGLEKTYRAVEHLSASTLRIALEQLHECFNLTPANALVIA